MGFQALSESIRDLLKGSRVYHVPRFQREFSWERRNHKELLNDMISQISIHDEKEYTLNPSQYFLGNMLFLGDKDAPEVEVIDGQQRLTTLTILLAAIRNKLYEISDDSTEDENVKNRSKDYADTTQEYLIKKTDGKAKKIIQASATYPFFTQTIQDYESCNTEASPATDEEDLLKDTFNYFLGELTKNKLQKILNIGGESESIQNIDKLKALRDQILNSQVIAIYASEKNQANQIFENINSKGKPLSKVDLIKNYIFTYVAPTSGGDVDEVHESWKKNRNLLFDYKLSLEEYFLHYWKAKYPSDKANANNIYDKFTKRFKENSKSISTELSTFVKDMSSAIELYKGIIQPDLNKFKRQELKYEYECLDGIAKFNGTQIRPALLSFYLKEQELEGKVDNKLKKSFLRFLCDFHFMAFGTGVNLRSNKVTGPCNLFSKAIMGANSKKDINTAIEQFKDKLRVLISQDLFIKEFQKLEFSKKTARIGLTNFPTSYAIKRLANQLDHRDHNDGNESIEHIVDESTENYTKNIGNLLILETKLNNDLGSLKIRDFQAKKSIYKKSSYKISQDLSKSKSNFNNETHVQDRAKKLANTFWDIFQND